MQYSEETIEKLIEIAEKKGEYTAVANYLGISLNKLLTKRRQYPALEKALSEAVKKYSVKNGIPYNYEFTSEELEEITKLVAKQNVDAAAKKYGGRADKFWRMRKGNPELEAAIVKGQSLRKGNTVFQRAMNLFSTFDSKQLKKVSEVAESGGLEAVERKYGFAAHALNRCRKHLLELDNAIKAGLRKRPIGAAVASGKKEAKERKIPKPYKTKDKLRNPPREIVNKTLSGIIDQSDTALIKFKKLIQERRLSENIKRLRNGDFDII